MEGLFSLLLFAGFFYFMMRFGCGAHMVHGHGGHKHGRDGAVGSADERHADGRGSQPHDKAARTAGVP
jgi:hypothetical protein